MPGCDEESINWGKNINFTFYANTYTFPYAINSAEREWNTRISNTHAHTAYSA